MAQATPATSGGANSGNMLAAAMKPLNGVLVRTTIQEKASPIVHRDQGAAAAGDQRVDEGLGHIGIGQHGEEIGDRQVAQAEALDHRIGVGQRSEQQRQHRVNDQKGQDCEQQQHPRAGQDIAALARMPILHRALRQRCDPRSKALPLGDDYFCSCPGRYSTRLAGGPQYYIRRFAGFQPRLRRHEPFFPVGPTYGHRMLHSNPRRTPCRATSLANSSSSSLPSPRLLSSGSLRVPPVPKRRMATVTAMATIPSTVTTTSTTTSASGASASTASFVRSVTPSARSAYVARPVAEGTCNCLTKEYTPEGTVVFKDLCTQEMASAPVDGAPEKTSDAQSPANFAGKTYQDYLAANPPGSGRPAAEELIVPPLCKKTGRLAMTFAGGRHV